MHFDCRRCGRCCREIGIPWSELDYRFAADCLKMNLEDFLEKYGFAVDAASGAIEHPEPGVTPCPFLQYHKQSAICKIYPARPWVCKGYPGPGITCRGGHKRQPRVDDKNGHTNRNRSASKDQ